MKTCSLTALGFALLLAYAPSAGGATILLTDNVRGDIPDGSSSGLARSFTVDAAWETITNVEVVLQIGATNGGEAFLGDLYVYLTNGTDLAVLLNRPGRSATSLAGYSDNQSLNVTFTNTAVEDIHNYRQSVTGSDSNPLVAALGGIWLADGRSSDPANVLDTDSSSARLDKFNGSAASNDWSLYVADLSSGGTHQLVSWSMQLTTVPEPSSLFLSACAFPLLLRRRRR
jgi:subtilisin-like proprotein convertase family protein